MTDKTREIDELSSSIHLNDLNDQQSVMLTLFPYINLNEEGLERIKNGDTIKVSELEQYLENPDAPLFDKLGIFEYGLTAFDSLRGKDTLLSVTESEFVDNMIEAGLGDIEITAQQDERGLTSSGFQAIAFQDSVGNSGISYRGSDFDLTRGALRDWVEANVMEFFKGSSTQSNQANVFFDQHKNADGNNYVFGASLGGNLSQHVYLQNYDDIEHIFTINGNPINQKALDTEEKIAAFNDPEKASFNVVCGDPISMLKSCDLYQNSVHYIKNNDDLRGLGGLESHIDMGVCDKDGNFKTTTRGDAISTMTPWLNNLTGFIRGVREVLNDIGDNLKKSNPEKTEMFNVFAKDVIGHLSGLKDELQFAQIFSNSHVLDTERSDPGIAKLGLVKDEVVSNLDKLFEDEPVLNIDKLFNGEAEFGLGGALDGDVLFGLDKLFDGEIDEILTIGNQFINENEFEIEDIVSEFERS
jgi:hypothetical protein